MSRIAIGGFQHETNTFAPTKADYRSFEEPGGWPGLTRGPAVLETFTGMNLPIAGFIEAATAQGHALVPLAWAQATPAAHVTEDAFERIVGAILDDLRAAMPVDAVYLDLHGAMVSEHHEDGEGEILARVRALVGPGVPLAASLDLHANVTPRMVEQADLLDAYRTYPHVDMAETGARTAGHLDRILQGARLAGKAFRKLPFLVPIQGGCTMVQPAKSLYARIGDLEAGNPSSVSFAAGFGPADIWECGPAVLAYASTQAAADRAADTLSAEIQDREADFASPVWSPEDAVAHAMARAAAASRPIVLADSQDNPGGGGSGDTVALLAALVAGGAQDAALAILFDPQAAAAAHEAGPGATLSIGLGAKSGMAGHTPFEGDFEVERLGDGRFTCKGPFAKGLKMELGPMALLRIGGVRIVVASRKTQAADREIFRHLGMEPSRQKILALKSSVHFRADFTPIAEEILVVKAPGANALDYSELDYRNLRPGVRLMPMGPAYSPPSGNAVS
jgi:microcystin degradation protein MlrC